MKRFCCVVLLALCAACGGGASPHISSLSPSAQPTTSAPADDPTMAAPNSTPSSTPISLHGSLPSSTPSPAATRGAATSSATPSPSPTKRATPAPARTTTAPRPRPTHAPTPAGSVVALSIMSYMFSPQNLTIPVGTTVRATNHDPATHTWTAKGTWDSGDLGTGQSYSFRFTKAGVFSYICSIHPFMTGKVTVT